MQAASAQKQADWLLQEARSHKRASWQHRKKAQDCLARLETLIAEAAKRGITITINDTKPRGGQGANRNSSTQAAGSEALAQH